MKSILFNAVLIAFVFLVTGCYNTKKSTAHKKPGNTEQLYQSEWKLVEVSGNFVPSASSAMLVLTPGQVNKVSGNTGCNRMTGTFELKGVHVISFSPLAVTKMACIDDNANKTEAAFTEALMQASSWRIYNDQLLLENGGAVVARFAGRKPASEEELKLNGTWELYYISGPKIAFEGLFRGKKPTIIFDFPGPETSGMGGCNGYRCKVNVQGNEITFGDPLSTMMACEGNGEPLYFKTLKTITSYHIEGDMLEMKAGDVAVLKFNRR